MTDKLEDIARSMRQWVERIGPIPSHEVVAKVFAWSRRIEACSKEVKPCTDASRLRAALLEIDNLITVLENGARFSKWKTMFLLQCKSIKETIDKVLEMPSRNCDRAECATIDDAAKVFLKETGKKMPESLNDYKMMIWVTEFNRWLYTVPEMKKEEDK